MIWDTICEFMVGLGALFFLAVILSLVVWVCMEADEFIKSKKWEAIENLGDALGVLFLLGVVIAGCILFGQEVCARIGWCGY